MRNGETERAIRALLLDVLEQCALHMDAAPQCRAQYKPIAHAVHAALEDFERQFHRSPDLLDSEHGQRLVSRAQEMSMEWLYSLQEIRREPRLSNELEILPPMTSVGRASLPNLQP